MRVLMLSWEYTPHVVGGLGKHVIELAPALVEQQIEVHVLTPLLRGGAEYEHTSDGVHIYRVPPSADPSYDFFAFVEQTNTLLARFAQTIGTQGQRFDLIHAHDWLTAAAGIALKHAWQCPLLATIHATERGRGQGVLLNEFSERVNQLEWQLTYEAWRVIACSHFMAQQVATYFHTPADKIDMVPNGVRVVASPFASHDEQQAFRSQFAAADERLVFHVGRIVYEKGVWVLLDAWPAIHAKQPTARLLIAGMGNFLESARARANELQLGEQVRFAGFIADEERDKLYRVADVAVFPSLYEPFGIVALEAMATHCPVVATATGGLREVVSADTGWIAPPSNPAELAETVLAALNEPAAAQQRADNALREVREQFNWPHIAHKTLAVYQRIAEAYRASYWQSG